MWNKNETTEWAHENVSLRSENNEIKLDNIKWKTENIESENGI